MKKINFSQIHSAKNAKLFGILPGGKEVVTHILKNKNGLELVVMNYGATIISLNIPISASKKIDVVMGFETLEDYIKSYYLPSPPYFGATVGRFAGRINNAEFSLNGRRNSLNKNHGKHNLHGGILGFSRQVWNIIKATPQSITYEYISPNNEENFPGEIVVRVTYTLTEENELKVNYIANSDEDTVINLTQHSYFNLDGHSEDITNQKLQINSKNVLETTDDLIPTGRFTPLNGHEFDFRNPKLCPTSIDNTFVLEDSNATVLFSEKNQIKMSVITNQPAVHVYVGGNCFNQLKGKENADYHTISGICFETQNFPDAPNHPHFPNAILKKGEEYNHQTIFKFEKLN